MSCLGKRKQKKKIMYSSHHSGEFEAYDIVLYEAVVLQENFQYGTLVLIGASGEGERGREGGGRGEGGRGEGGREVGEIFGCACMCQSCLCYTALMR